MKSLPPQMESLSSSFLVKHPELLHVPSFGIISSSFLVKHPELLHVPSFGIIVKKPQHMITTNSSLTTFQPVKELIKKNTFSPTFEIPSKQVDINKQSLVGIIFNTLDDLICTFLDSPVRPSIDPKHVLSGNDAPVNELPPTACEVVEGSLPSCLDGAYIRNGPNPQFIPKGPYHFLDGDGMLHMIKISKGKATFCSRYVNTHKHIMEREIGYPFVLSVFASFNGLAATMARLALAVARVLAGQLDPLNHGCGAANTSVALFGGQLFALCESDLPYAVKVTQEGDIITLDRHDFQSNEPLLSMTAHPKIDRETGEAFAYRYNVERPFLTFFRIDSQGRKQKDVPIYSVKGCTIIHDFAVTKNFAVLPETQIVVNPSWVLRGRSPVGTDFGRMPRLGIIPRYAEDESEMRWIDTPGFNMLHCVNSWEEDGGDTIVMVASNIASVEEMFENPGLLSRLTLEKIIIDVKAKSMERHPLSNEVLDFAVINPAYASKRNRYVYAGVVGTETWIGVVKLDLSLADAVDGSNCTVASHLYGPGWCGGEPFFVAREPNNLAMEEDDGYLVTYVHDENTNQSKFLVMDAKSTNLDIIAVVKLPGRVPDGFHGLFVSQSDLSKL